MPGILPLSSKAEPSLQVLAEVEPWPVVSRLIGFDGRLWFANSVKGRNHNSADLFSYDPDEGDVRYERHLFSQDAAVPSLPTACSTGPSRTPASASVTAIS